MRTSCSLVSRPTARAADSVGPFPTRHRDRGTALARPGRMELGNQRASGNVEDRRGLGMVGGGLGVGGIVVAVIAYFLGFDPGTALQVGEQVSSSSRHAQQAPRGTPNDEMGQFVSRVLGSTEDVWGR